MCPTFLGIPSAPKDPSHRVSEWWWEPTHTPEVPKDYEGPFGSGVGQKGVRDTQFGRRMNQGHTLRPMESVSMSHVSDKTLSPSDVDED